VHTERQNEQRISNPSPGIWKAFDAVAAQVKTANSHRAGTSSRHHPLSTVPELAFHIEEGHEKLT